MQQRVVPEGCEQLRSKLNESRAYQFRSLPEITNEINQQNVYLPLSSREVAWVQVTQLQERVQLLDYCRIITVRSCDHDG